MLLSSASWSEVKSATVGHQRCSTKNKQLPSQSRVRTAIIFTFYWCCFCPASSSGASSLAWRLAASSSSTTTSTGGITSTRPDTEVQTAAPPAVPTWTLIKRRCSANSSAFWMYLGGKREGGEDLFCKSNKLFLKKGHCYIFCRSDRKRFL